MAVEINTLHLKQNNTARLGINVNLFMGPLPPPVANVRHVLAVLVDVLLQNNPRIMTEVT
jgi:hypothetical protein